MSGGLEEIYAMMDESIPRPNGYRAAFHDEKGRTFEWHWLAWDAAQAAELATAAYGTAMAALGRDPAAPVPKVRPSTTDEPSHESWTIRTDLIGTAWAPEEALALEHSALALGRALCDARMAEFAQRGPCRFAEVTASLAPADDPAHVRCHVVTAFRDEVGQRGFGTTRAEAQGLCVALLRLAAADSDRKLMLASRAHWQEPASATLRATHQRRQPEIREEALRRACAALEALGAPGLARDLLLPDDAP